LLPEPLGPMTAWTSPGLRVRLMPLRICFPSTPALRFLISRMGLLIFKIVGLATSFLARDTPDLMVSPCFSAHAAFEADAEELLGFYGEFHGQFLEYFFAEAIHD